MKSTDSEAILVADDDPHVLGATARLLRDAGYRVVEAPTGRHCLELLQEESFDLALLDVVLPDTDGGEICRKIKSDPSMEATFVVLLSGSRTSPNQQADGLDLGADGYIARPVSNRELLSRVQSMLRIRRAEQALRRAHQELEKRVKERTAELAQANQSLRNEIEVRKKTEADLQAALSEIRELKDRLHAENLYLQEEIKHEHNFDEILGKSDAIEYVLYKVGQVAPTEATVLILGETGTGKELIARAIHGASSRSDRPLVKVNCAALPSNLIESELFGHQKGAFTGAQTKQLGRFEVADGATLFLDEIGELPFELQAKLLRVLQDGEFERLGSSSTIKVDVRVIAATNRNLEEEVEAGRFREDLWYRLNVFPITAPPLRQRKEDIPLLTEAFVRRFSKKMGKNVSGLSPNTLKALKGYSWPGNVRELENVIERAVIVSPGPSLEVEIPRSSGPDRGRADSLEEMERNHILSVLDACKWKIEGRGGAAEALALKPGTLRSRMKKLGIERPI